MFLAHTLSLAGQGIDPGEILAVVRAEGQGRWQYSQDGQAWIDLGKVYHGRARLLRGADFLRFLPGVGARQSAKVSYRLHGKVKTFDGSLFQTVTS
jgi:hypothetical protein